MGYFPVEQPKYSCIVVIHRPDKSKGYYGATVAAPVFKIIAKKIFNDIPQQLHLEASMITDLIEYLQLQKDLKIPNLEGLSSQEAIEKLEAIGLRAELKGTGSVKPSKG